ELIVARERLGRHGIRVGFFIQLGYLGEELADLLATRELVAQAAPDDIGVSVSYPLPGTRFYELVKARLGRKTHWRDSGDLAMMFRGAYDSEFYRGVRDLLHEQVALQQTKAGTPPKRYRVASAALAARWDALVAREHAHRNHDATPPPVPRGIALQVRYRCCRHSPSSGMACAAPPKRSLPSWHWRDRAARHPRGANWSGRWPRPPPSLTAWRRCSTGTRPGTTRRGGISLPTSARRSNSAIAASSNCSNASTPAPAPPAFPSSR